MLGTIRRARASIFAVLLGGAAITLFAFAGSEGVATATTQTQNLEATISSQVSWGTANNCTQNMATNNFGELVPNPTASTLGPFDALPHTSASTVGPNHVWVGCVTTNSTLASVTAEGTEDMKTTGGSTLPLSDVSIGLTNASSGKVNNGTAGCEIAAGQTSLGSCTLTKSGTPQTLVTNASEGTTELNWQYQLNLPANQPVGSYTGGEVTFTATA